MTDTELEEAIYYAMVEMGWLFPIDVRGVELAEKAMECEEGTELPVALREPPWAKARKAGLIK